jgi:hypothetical protein
MNNIFWSKIINNILILLVLKVTDNPTMNQHRIAHHIIYEISIKYHHLYSSVVFSGSSSKGEWVWFSDATPN